MPSARVNHGRCSRICTHPHAGPCSATSPTPTLPPTSSSRTCWGMSRAGRRCTACTGQQSQVGVCIELPAARSRFAARAWPLCCYCCCCCCGPHANWRAVAGLDYQLRVIDIVLEHEAGGGKASCWVRGWVGGCVQLPHTLAGAELGAVLVAATAQPPPRPHSHHLTAHLGVCGPT